MLENPRSPRVRAVAKLSKRNAREESGLFLVEGPQSVREALAFHPAAIVDLYATPASMERHTEIRAAAALVAAEAASRGAMVRQWHDLPAARPGGTADRAGPPDERAMLVAMAGALFIATITILPTFGLWALLVGLAVLTAATIGCAWLSLNQIGGQTGDTLGACQQCAAIAFLIGITPFA